MDKVVSVQSRGVYLHFEDMLIQNCSPALPDKAPEGRSRSSGPGEQYVAIVNENLLRNLAVKTVERFRVIVQVLNSYDRKTIFSPVCGFERSPINEVTKVSDAREGPPVHSCSSSSSSSSPSNSRTLSSLALIDWTSSIA